jgi:chitin synthase
VFEFINVLPGAIFLAYRYEALLNNEHGDGPHWRNTTRAKRCMVSTLGSLLPTRTWQKIVSFCFELVGKRNSRWLLKYVKAAHAVTDAPRTLSELWLQRWRWLNGSFFCCDLRYFTRLQLLALFP